MATLLSARRRRKSYSDPSYGRWYAETEATSPTIVTLAEVVCDTPAEKAVALAAIARAFRRLDRHHTTRELIWLALAAIRTL